MADKIYVDCSGDEGFEVDKKRGKGSSRVYVATGVYFPEPAPVIARIKRLHGELEMGDSDEFKFAELSRPRQYAFLAALASFPFLVYALIVPKDIITSPHLKDDGTRFRHFFCRLLLTKGISRTNFYATIDNGEGNQKQVDDCWKYLMREVNAEVPNKLAGVQFVDSHKYQLVQAADMCAGAIRKAHLGQAEYRKLIEHGIRRGNEWVFQAKKSPGS